MASYILIASPSSTDICAGFGGQMFACFDGKYQASRSSVYGTLFFYLCIATFYHIRQENEKPQLHIPDILQLCSKYYETVDKETIHTISIIQKKNDHNDNDNNEENSLSQYSQIMEFYNMQQIEIEQNGIFQLRFEEGRFTDNQTAQHALGAFRLNHDVFPNSLSKKNWPILYDFLRYSLSERSESYQTLTKKSQNIENESFSVYKNLQDHLQEKKNLLIKVYWKVNWFIQKIVILIS